MGEFNTYIGNTIYPLGFPVVIVAISEHMELQRIVEFFVLMIHPDGEAEYYPQRCFYRNIPKGILSDQDLLDGTLMTVLAKLDLVIDEKRGKLEDSQKIMVPYSLRFSLEPLSPSKLRFLLIHYALGDQVEKIRNQTICTELKDVLPLWPEKEETRWLVKRVEDF